MKTTLEVALLRNLLVQTTSAYEEKMALLEEKEAQLHHEKERALVTLHAIGDGVITTDTDGQVLYLNPAAEMLTGWSLAEARGQQLSRVFKLVCEPSHELPGDLISECLVRDDTIALCEHTTLLSRHGKEFAIEETASPMRDLDGNQLGVVIVFHDVTEQRSLKNKLMYQASHDALTDLVNRREFEQRLRQAMELAQQRQGVHSLLYLDLDQFKLVNDTCGHVAGDELLKQISRELRAKLRDSDILARLGGDEFGVLLEHCPIQKGYQIAEVLHSIIKSQPFRWDEHLFNIGVSIGVVEINEFSRSLRELLSAADIACYAAKEQGRNRIHLYRESDEELNRRHGEMHWASRINKALQEQRFELYIQEIIPLNEENERTHGEILLRLRTSDGTLVPPGHFIPAAERYDLMVNLDQWVIRNTFHALGKLPQQQLETLQVSINLSGSSLGTPTLSRYIEAQFMESGIPPQAICFEITETAAIGNLEHATRLIRTLRDRGCNIALDDFGSGLSSFAYLKNLPVDYIKIDGLFVRQMSEDPMDLAIVQAIHQVANTLQIQTVAEFVENTTLLNMLRDIGIHFSQGYAVHHPEPLLKWLAGKLPSDR